MKHLKEAGIGIGNPLSVPLHLQKAYFSLNYSAGDFPVTESAATEIISLPMYPHLTDRQQSKVAEEILAFTSKTACKRTEPAAGWLEPAVKTA